jgi:hypothetical protein
VPFNAYSYSFLLDGRQQAMISLARAQSSHNFFSSEEIAIENFSMIALLASSCSS